MDIFNFGFKIQGYENIPAWRVAELEADEYEQHLVEIGYYENMEV